MRRIVAVSVALALVFVTAGCLLNRYSSDPAERIQQLNAPAGALTSSARPVEAASPAAPDPLELRKSLAEKKARLHETHAQLYKLEAQRYAVQQALRDLEAQIAADERALGAAPDGPQSQEAGPRKHQKPVEGDPGASPSQAAPPKGPQGATTPPLSSRFWAAVDRLQSSLGVRLINVYSSDPNKRVEKLLNNSEDLRQIEYEWERIWSADQPSHLTPERLHGCPE